VLSSPGTYIALCYAIQAKPLATGNFLRRLKWQE
jgi:hypothetical protein